MTTEEKKELIVTLIIVGIMALGMVLIAITNGVGHCA